jgi:hypothetical protein
MNAIISLAAICASSIAFAYIVGLVIEWINDRDLERNRQWLLRQGHHDD